MSEFDRYAPWSSVAAPKTVESKPEKISSGDFIAADQANLAENPPPEEPRSKFAQRATEAAAVVGGGATGAALKYKQGMFGPSVDAKYQYSVPGAGGNPVSQFDLSMPAGQNVEDARRKLQVEIAKWQSAGGMRDVEASKLRGGYERSLAEVPEAVAAREEALSRLASTGALKAPAAPPASVSAAPYSGTGADLINRIQSAETSASSPVSSLGKAFGQHEYEMQAKYLRDAGVRTVEDLQRMGIVDRGLAEYMASRGMFLPTPEGRVLVRPQTLMGAEGQPVASAEDLAAQQAARQSEEVAARARAQAEMLRAREVESARSGYGTAKSGAMSAEKAAQTELEKYLKFMGQRGLESEKLAPNVKLAQDALLQARGQMPSSFVKGINVAQRALPVLGGVAAGMGAGEMGSESYERSQRGDPIGSAISGIGAASSAASAIPGLAIPGAIGALGSAGALALYDKYGPAILPYLEKKELIPKGWNPANYSVMDRR